MSRQITPSVAQAEAALRSQAQRTKINLTKSRARAYAKAPLTLENISPGLSCAQPDAMIAVGEHLLRMERQRPRRWFGFGGETPAINAQAVRLFGRLLRRAAAS
jgi:hypothetical protein